MQAVFHGITVAAVSGLLFGAAFKPNVAEGGLIPPHIQMAESADRQGHDTGGFAFAGYQGQMPDYVLGTDWSEPAEGAIFEADYAEQAYEPDAYLEPVRAVRAEYARADAQLVPVAYPALERAYPSTNGDIMPAPQPEVVEVQPVKVKAPIIVAEAVEPAHAPLALAALD